MLAGVNGPPTGPEEEKSPAGLTVIGPAFPAELTVTLRDAEADEITPPVHWAFAVTGYVPDVVQAWDCGTGPKGELVPSPHVNEYETAWP